MPKDIFPSTLTNNTPKGVYTFRQIDFGQGTPRWILIESFNVDLRENHGFSAVHTRLIITGFAIVDAGYIAKAFCYIYDVKTGQRWEDSQIRPLGFHTHLTGLNRQIGLSPIISFTLVKMTYNFILKDVSSNKWKIELSKSGLLYLPK